MGLLIALSGIAAQTSAPGETDEILAQLSKIRLDKTQTYVVRDINLRRDALSISLSRGVIGFLEPVGGKVTGAVFIGRGELVTFPPDAVERQQVSRFTGAPVINETFRSAYFRFTDDTYEEILKQRSEQAEETLSAEDLEEFVPAEAILNEHASAVSVNYRILADLFGSGTQPVFFGELEGEKAGWFRVLYDLRAVEEVSVFKTDVWTSFNQRSELRNPEAFANESKTPIDVLAYDIDATIGKDEQLDVQAKIRFKPLSDGERVLAFDLSPSLRVSSAALVDTGEAVWFHQAVGAPLLLVFPRALTRTEEVAVDLKYAGLRGENWYPVLGTRDDAVFNLTFHRPGEADPVVWNSGGEITRPANAFPAAPNSAENDAAREAVEKVRWSSYHDQWLVEGLSKYMSAMKTNAGRLTEMLAEARTRLMPHENGGPISLGNRLSGYSELLPNKGVWVVHMLRMLTNLPDDAAFVNVIDKFLESYQGKAASMWEFRRFAENYVPDKKLDWFFDEWVSGTGIPSYALEYKIEPVQNGFVIEGAITQSEVPDTFVMPVPIYADDEMLGRVSVGDEDGHFRFNVKKRPERVAIDPHDTILKR
jgi:hypothetical protein